MGFLAGFLLAIAVFLGAAGQYFNGLCPNLPCSSPAPATASASPSPVPSATP